MVKVWDDRLKRLAGMVPRDFIKWLLPDARLVRPVSLELKAQKLFFAPREDLASNAYVLNLERPGASRFVKQFQKCIEEKHNAPNRNTM